MACSSLLKLREILDSESLTKQLSTLKYTCRYTYSLWRMDNDFSGEEPTDNWPGFEVPVSAHLWEEDPQEDWWMWRRLVRAPSSYANFFRQNLVELQLSVESPTIFLLELHRALEASGKTCLSLRSLQVGSLDPFIGPSNFIHCFRFPMGVVLVFLHGLRLPSLKTLDFFGGVSGQCTPRCEWPHVDNLPALQTFCGPSAPTGRFGLFETGVHFNCIQFDDPHFISERTVSALGAALGVVHLHVYGSEEQRFASAFSSLAQLGRLRWLRVVGDYSRSTVRAGDLSVLSRLEMLALDNVQLEGSLTCPRLTAIECHGARMPAVLGNPPPALRSVSVFMDAAPCHEIGPSILGIPVPREEGTVRMCVSGHWWEFTRGLHPWKSSSWCLEKGALEAVLCCDAP